MHAKTPILFVINSIAYGGAERALLNILSVRHRYPQYQIHLALLDNEEIVRPLPEDIIIHVLNGERGFGKSLLQLYQLHQQIKPKVCISFLVRANVCNAIINRFSPTSEAIICERMHLSSHLDGKYSGFKRKLYKQLPALTYRFASKALGVSTGVTEDLVGNFNVRREKAGTVFNPYDIDFIQQQAKRAAPENLPKEYVISAGRLSKGKNVFNLIDAFIASKETAPLVILGTGEQEEEIKAYIAGQQLQKRVILAGYSHNPFAIIRRAKYYVSFSLNEGFPNAMVEAMILKRPIIMSNCPSGPAEILAKNSRFTSAEFAPVKYGILVPMHSNEQMTAAINFMQNAQERKRYSDAAYQRSQDFALTKIASEYWQQIAQFT
ncbi:glycosyltransferase [Alteromonas pelagimontana]|uniref:Glycosyltransferase n=2 Tax=Alteromonas pelagimontana TaxID=1858656 RepID=A0A6M4MI93_9ALTE|nr:glycosyltransferase [Alteromonas pelagimontana]